MVYGDYVTKQKKYISTTTIHMTTKLGNGVTYHEEDPWGSQAGPWIRWSFEITWKTKTTISPLLQSLWPQNLARWWLNLAAFTCKVAWLVFMYSFEITWQTKIVVYPLSQCLQLLNFAGWVYAMSILFQKLTQPFDQAVF